MSAGWAFYFTVLGAAFATSVHFLVRGLRDAVRYHQRTEEMAVRLGAVELAEAVDPAVRESSR